MFTLSLFLPEWHWHMFCLGSQDSASCLGKGMLVTCLMSLYTAIEGVQFPFHPVMDRRNSTLLHFLATFNRAIYLQSIGNRLFYGAACVRLVTRTGRNAPAEMRRGRCERLMKPGLRRLGFSGSTPCESCCLGENAPTLSEPRLVNIQDAYHVKWVLDFEDKDTKI